MTDPKFIRPSQSQLVEETRRFWFNNIPGTINVDGQDITRGDIYTYGGPNPWITHPQSQKMEWMSRVRQKNLFKPHESPDEEMCKTLCERQGDELWTHHHQNFDFAMGCDSGLNAPMGILILPDDIKHFEGYSAYSRFQNAFCDQFTHVLKRRLSMACQYDVVAYPEGIDWQQYDFLFTINIEKNRPFPRPSLPVILYGHDLWLNRKSLNQKVVDWIQPDILLTPYPSAWEKYIHYQNNTHVVFMPFAPSMFFTRPNLKMNKKCLDLLVIGALQSHVYVPRIVLSHQIRSLIDRYAVEFSHHVGARRNVWNGATIQQYKKTKIHYLNQWSSYLGSARYVVFGRTGENLEWLFGKYYETMGSGAIPIFPEVPDLKLLGIKPFEHYIPLSEVEGNNERLTYFLDHYEDYFNIAQNAVSWCQNNMDRMVFEDFETIIHEVTAGRYPKRLVI